MGQKKYEQNDSQFSITHRSRRRQLRKRRKSNNSQLRYKVTNGKWTKGETQLYIKFLRQHKDILGDFKERRETKVFKKMSIFVETRTADQCRSHHQKVQKFHSTNIDEIINHYQKKINQGFSHKHIKKQHKELPTTKVQAQQELNLKVQSFYDVIIQQQSLQILMNFKQVQTF